MVWEVNDSVAPEGSIKALELPVQAQGRERGDERMTDCFQGKLRVGKRN